MKRFKDRLFRETLTNHEYLNCSLGGTNISSTVFYIVEDLFFDFDVFKPTFCFIEKSVNDKIFGYSSMEDSEKNRLIAEHLSSLNQLVKYLLSLNIKLVFIHMYFKPDLDFSWKQGSGLDYIHRNYDQVAEKYDIPSVNVTQYIEDNYSQSLDQILLDSYHLSPYGSNCVGDYIFGEIEKLSVRYSEKPTFEKDFFTVAVTHDSIFSSSLLTTTYARLKYPFEVKIAVETPAQLKGLFFIPNQYSGMIEFVSDQSSFFEFSVFDPFCWMERLHYMGINFDFFIDQEIVIKSSWKPVNHQLALDEYNSSAMFDPQAQWAIDKYLNPLLDAVNNPTQRSFSLAFLCFYKTPS